MASAEKLPSGRWRGLYRDADGRKRRVPGTFPRKSDAKEAAQEKEVAAKRQAAANSGTLTARTLWSDWWDIVVKDRDFDSDTPRVEADLVKRFIRPKWGGLALNKIEQPEVQAWVDELCRQGHSATYVNRVYSVFRVSIRVAVKRKILLADPCSAIELPKRVKKPKLFIDFEEELPSILAKLEQPWRDVVELMMETGLRPNEVSGLHSHRADLNRSELTVAEVFVYRKGVIRGWPKDQETRVVPLSSKAKAIIRRNLQGRDLHQGCGMPHVGAKKCAHPLVFTHKGKAFKTDAFWYQLREALKAAGLDHKTPYAARRGFATRMADAGMDAFALADVMGHSDVAETRGYVQRSNTAKSKFLAALGDAQPLKVVGRRGTERGTNLDNQESSEAPIEEAGNAS
jgi:integrase